MNKFPTAMAGAFVLTCAAGIFSDAADANGYIRARGAYGNTSGGVTGAAMSAGSGANGAYVRGRRYTTGGAGNATIQSGAAYRGANGGTAARAGQTTRNADGSISRQSAFSASGPNADIKSSGGLTKDINGISASRHTEATDANGNSYNGSTAYSKDTGITHTGTCTDASGNVISCR